jgi:biotin carboxyl carrier protein
MAKNNHSFFSEEETPTHIHVDGDTYTTHEVAKRTRSKKYARLPQHIIHAAIPGTIQKIYVKEGQRVRLETPLLMLEAMKMMNTISATQEGVVKTVHVQVGDKVGKNQPLVEFEI